MQKLRPGALAPRAAIAHALAAALLVVAGRAAAAQADTAATVAAATAAAAADTTHLVPAAAPAADSTPPADSVRHVARLLVANGAPEHRATTVAAAVMKYARLRAIDPLLLVGVIGVENASLSPSARSRAGARGVMQVMPFWKKDIRGCGADMHDVNVNVCLGTAVLRIALDASRSVREALLRYNGCVRAPGCTKYATAVFGRAGHALLMTRLAEGATAPAPAVATRKTPTNE
jgi:soluble lytic murein transglycosylase-like protein